MKKPIITILFAFAFLNQACRKERSCSCSTISTEVTVIGNNTNTVTTKTSTKITKNKQKKAEFKKTEMCYSEKKSFSTSTTVTTIDKTCTLN